MLCTHVHKGKREDDEIYCYDVLDFYGIVFLLNDKQICQ